jgi:hypothetical protein
MKFYLKWINPLVAILILLFCCWIYFGGYFVGFGEKSPFAKGKLIIDTAEMGFSMYFFAKGLFCSSSHSHAHLRRSGSGIIRLSPDKSGQVSLCSFSLGNS